MSLGRCNSIYDVKIQFTMSQMSLRRRNSIYDVVNVQ